MVQKKHCCIAAFDPLPQPRISSRSFLSLHCRDTIMPSSVPPTQLPQSQASLLGPGIAGLFIQGIESGLVFAQFSQWFFASDRSESSLFLAVVVFVTLVGLYASSRHLAM
jgi:hypothetical protein